jgi:hypothetical protein
MNIGLNPINNSIEQAPWYIWNFDRVLKIFYKRTFLDPVDLSDKNIEESQKELLQDTSIKKVYEEARQLIKDTQIKKHLVKPFSSLDNIDPMVKEIKRQGFKCLAEKEMAETQGYEISDFFSVLEHEKLDGWLIKSGGPRFDKNYYSDTTCCNSRLEKALFSSDDPLLRVEMAERIRKKAKELNIDIKIPKKILVPYKDIESEKDPSEKYFVLVEKVDIMPRYKTIKKIAKMSCEEREKFGRDLIKIVKICGIADANFRNIGFTKDGKLCIFDTEPLNLLKRKKGNAAKRQPFQNSVEKCGRIGLFGLYREITNHLLSQEVYDRFCWKLKRRASLSIQILKDEEILNDEEIKNLKSFRNQIKLEYNKIPELSTRKLLLSLVPFLSIIYVIGILVKKIINFFAAIHVIICQYMEVRYMSRGKWNSVRNIRKSVKKSAMFLERPTLCWPQSFCLC